MAHVPGEQLSSKAVETEKTINIDCDSLSMTSLKERADKELAFKIVQSLETISPGFIEENNLISINRGNSKSVFAITQNDIVPVLLKTDRRIVA